MPSLEVLVEGFVEFFEAAEDSLKKGRFRPAVSDFFKAAVSAADHLLYQKLQIGATDHRDRFDNLRLVGREEHALLRRAFSVYRRSYTRRMTGADAREVKRIAEKFRAKAGF